MQETQMARLFDLIATLRGPDGCPWDREQSFEDVLSDLIEEAYELEWAAAHNNAVDVLDEMGDVLFLTCFAISIRRESDPGFTIERAAQHAWEKIHRRHPHVFGDATASTPEESIVHWEAMKSRERAERTPGAGALDGIAGNLPPLRRAEKVQERAATVGFDWDGIDDVVAKVHEELGELEEAIASDDRDHIRAEIGDLLFSVVNVARFLKIDPATALSGTTSRFIHRFERMEVMIATDGKRLADMTLTEMDAYWETVKKRR